MSEDQLTPFSKALEDYSAEGAEILYAEPSRLIRLSIGLMFLVVLSLIAWSFVGHADIIVSAPGVLSPENEVRRVYAPAEGELVSMRVRAGDSITEGEVLATLRSQAAVQLEVEARQAEMVLENVLLEMQQLPVTQAANKQKERLAEAQISSRQDLLDARIISGPAARQQDQRARLTLARNGAEQAQSQERQAYRDWQGKADVAGEGVAANVVEAARLAYLEAQARSEQAQADLRALESRFIEENTEDDASIVQAQNDLDEARLELVFMRQEHAQVEEKLGLQLMKAQADAQAMQGIKVESQGADNLITIFAPVGGVISQVTFDQPGDRVQSSTPLITIAPRDARKVLKLQIPEYDGGFLEVGSPVKIKFAAFPYQQHGFIAGVLSEVSPTTQKDAMDAPPYFKALVNLEKDHFTVRGQRRELRYGMTATAEIVVRERRLIDMAIDPLRGS